MTRCDMCGPYTPHQAAMMMLGTWRPTRTGQLCVADLSQALADDIDARAADSARRSTLQS